MIENEDSQTGEEATPEASTESSKEDSGKQENPSPVTREEFDEMKKQNSQFFERFKKTDAKLEDYIKKNVVTSKEGKASIDPAETARIMVALGGLDSAEQNRLIQEAKLKEISLEDARKDEDFVLWQTAHKEKVEKDKGLTPSTKQQSGGSTTSKARTEKFKAGLMTEKEETEFLEDAGVLKTYPLRGNPRFNQMPPTPSK